MPRPDAWSPDEELALGGAGFVAAILLLLLLLLLLPSERKRSVRVPFIATVVFTLFEGARLLLTQGPWSKPLRVFAVFFLLFAVGRALYLLLFESRLSSGFAGSLPKIFRDIVQVLIYAGVVLVTLNVAGAEPGSLLTTSALITAVIGLSLQDTLGNLFSGLALEAQRPFEVGDWVMFDGDQSSIGQVIEMNWRATKVVSLDSVEVIVPNGTIAKAALRNFTKPTPVLRRTVRINVAHSTPPERVKQTMLTAVAGVPGALAWPEPSVLLLEFGEAGLTYALRYFTSDYRLADATDSLVRERIWYGLKRAEIPISFPQRDVHLRQVSEESKQKDRLHSVDVRDAALRHVNLFKVLSPEEHRQLAQDTQTQLFTPGEMILQQGQAGSELYLILEGEVSVLMQQDGTENELARLGKGQFFGEMSLMTGQVRNASVRAVTECEVLVVAHEPFRRLLDARPDLAERLSEILAQRQLELEVSSRDSLRARAQREEQASKQLLDRIREFFHL